MELLRDTMEKKEKEKKKVGKEEHCLCQSLDRKKEKEC